MDLGAELALDIAIEAVTAGAATPGVAAKRAGTAARLAEHALVLTEDAVEALTRRTEAMLQRAKQALRRVPEDARAALLDTIDVASGVLDWLKGSVKVADAAEFLEDRGIEAPGYTLTPSPVDAVGLVEDTTPEEAKRTVPDAEVEFREHQRGVLVLDDQWGMVPGVLSKSLKRRAYMLLRNREDGWFCCIVSEPGKEAASYSPVRPDPNLPPLDNILGETTLEGILRALEIPGELLGL